MSTIRTGTMDILVSESIVTDLFTPMTGPMNSNDIREVRFRVRGAASALSSPYVKPGMQFSDDGVKWTDPGVALNYSFAPLLTNDWDWTSFESWLDIFASTATERLFVRFGLVAKSASGTLAGAAQADMVIEMNHVSAETFVGGPKLVAGSGKGATANPVFWPLTDWVRSTEAVKARSSIEILQLSSVSTIKIASGCQVGDDLTDPSTWTTTALSNYVAKGVMSMFGTSYADINSGVPPTEAWIRFGVFAEHQGSGGNEPGQAVVQLRIDTRDR